MMWQNGKKVWRKRFIFIEKNNPWLLLHLEKYFVNRKEFVLCKSHKNFSYFNEIFSIEPMM